MAVYNATTAAALTGTILGTRVDRATAALPQTAAAALFNVVGGRLSLIHISEPTRPY